MGFSDFIHLAPADDAGGVFIYKGAIVAFTYFVVAVLDQKPLIAAFFMAMKPHQGPFAFEPFPMQLKGKFAFLKPFEGIAYGFPCASVP